jgi:4-amino-4-deoxy-L-arabinose transferase-like glycosyltransferase
MQWNISFMTESFFFSFLILFLTFLLKQKKIYYFFSGIFFGLAILQKFFIIYFLFFIFLYFFIKKKNFLSKEMVIFFIGIFLMLFTLIISNYLRSNSFYLSPMQSYLHFPQYFEYRLLSREKNITLSESQNILNNQNKSWIEANLKTNNEYERLKYYKHLNQNSLKTIFRNKYEFSKMILKSSMKIIMINPTQMWFNHTKYPDWKEFSKTEDFKYAFYIKLFYSLALYTICFIGIIKFNIKKNPSLFFLHLSFILYFIIFASVGLNERYFVSSIIFFALFFSSGLEKILVKFKFSNEKKK